MKLILSLLTIAILIAVAAFAPKAIRNRDRVHEDRLLGVLKVIERTIEASSDDVRRIGLFAPKIAPLSSADSWLVEGVVTSNDVVGEQTYARFDAALTQKCDDLLQAVCWQLDWLTVGEATLVRAGQRAGSIDDVASTGEAIEPAIVGAGGPDTQSVATIAPTPAVPAVPATLPPVPATSPPPPASTAAAPPPSESDAVTAQIQSKLQELGYNPGPADGMMGPRTVSAILAYQRRNGLQMDGLANDELLKHLNAR